MVYGTCQLNENRINGVRGVVVPGGSKVHMDGITTGRKRDGDGITAWRLVLS